MVKKYFKTSLLLAVGAMLAWGLTSCEKNNNGDDEKELTEKQKEMSKIAEQYPNHTINITYKNLAAETSELYDKLKAAKEKFLKDPKSLTQAEVDAICETFKTARASYESSEAFLFGAATDFGVDPHIDTWPLDVDGLAAALTNKYQLEKLGGDEDDAIAYAAGKLGQELLGFHGIEFVIFRNGKNRTVAALQANEDDAAFTKIKAQVTGAEELTYAAAVAGDLRDNCYRLEVAWNANAPEAHKKRMEDIGLPTTRTNGKTYTQDLLGATKAGSGYATWEEVMTTILKAGCENIADEVANTKIGNPYSGKDKNYIESPYSQRSFIDFHDNLISIQNSLYGGIAGSRNEAVSIIAFMKKYDKDQAAKLENDLKAALKALEDCQTKLKGGFVNNITDPLVGEAQKKIQALDEDLNKAAEWFSKQ